MQGCAARGGAGPGPTSSLVLSRTLGAIPQASPHPATPKQQPILTSGQEILGGGDSESPGQRWDKAAGWGAGQVLPAWLWPCCPRSHPGHNLCHSQPLPQTHLEVLGLREHSAIHQQPGPRGWADGGGQLGSPSLTVDTGTQPCALASPSTVTICAPLSCTAAIPELTGHSQRCSGCEGWPS